MQKFSSWPLKVIAVALLAAAIYAGFSFLEIEWVENFELVLLNLRVQLRGELSHDDDVVIVAVDDKSLSYYYQHHDNPWPWSRDIHAEIIEELNRLGARSIVMDLAFDTYQEPEGDQKLAETLFFNPNVVLSTLLVDSRENFTDLDPEYRQRLKESEEYLQYRYNIRNPESLPGGRMPELFSTYKLIPPEQSFKQAAYAYGTFEIGLPQADGLFHSIPLVVNEHYAREEGELSRALLPNITVLGLASYYGLDRGEYSFDPAAGEIHLGEEAVIPVDSSGYFELTYYGERAFQEVSVVDLLEHGEEEELQEIFEDALVLVGFSAEAKGLYDDRPTPFNRNEAGVQLHATAMDNILNENFRHRLTLGQNMLIIIGVVLVLLLLQKVEKFKLGTGLSLGFITLVNLGNYLLFLNDIWADIFYVNLVLVLLLLTSTFLRFYRERKDRLQTKSFFSRYVPAPVVNRILENPDRIHPGGEEMEVTVLFSDIVNFTGISEELEPQKLVSLLNEYLACMADIIKNEHRGMLDKFIGDAILAIFGSPFPAEDDPVRAVAAALAMVEAAREMKQEWRERGEEVEFDLGIGINTGTAVVGNIGSEERVNYTCIGDAVNLAARLEGLTRELEGKVLISESTYEQVKDVFACRRLRQISVKNRSEPVTVYRVLGYREEKEEEFNHAE